MPASRPMSRLRRRAARRERLIEAAQFVMEYYGTTAALLVVAPLLWLLAIHTGETFTPPMWFFIAVAAVAVLGDVAGHVAVIVERRHADQIESAVEESHDTDPHDDTTGTED